MTNTQKRILIVLAVIALLLGIGLFVMHRTIYLEESLPPQQQGEVPVVHIELTPIPSGQPTASPTMGPVVEITISAPDEVPTATADPIADEPYPKATPTPEPAYIHLPTAAPIHTPIPSVPQGMAFMLSILGKNVNVASNVDTDTLEKTPGWLPTSAKPGKEGVCVVYGHRNRNHLLILKEIEKNDEIDVIMSDGKVYTYVVDKTEILETDEAMRIPTIEGKHLMLMTCYPFYYTGHAPKKFVVTCTLVEPLENTLLE